MAQVELDVVPETHRQLAASTLTDTFGPGGATSIDVVTGGASGALTYRVGSRHGDHLLRIETIRGPLRNPHQYDCMQRAADAGVAPPLRHVDADAGVVVMPFIEQRPVLEFDGGLHALAVAVADLLARLHDTAPFPEHGDHLDNIERMLGYLVSAGRVAPALLDAHREGFARIRAAYPWDPATFVSAHNDPNQLNVLYDGSRLWLVDWETARRNDPMVDVATVIGWLGTTPERRAAILRAWLGREPDALTDAKATLMGLLTALHAGAILLMIVFDPTNPVHTDLTPLTAEDFGARVASGELVAGTPAATIAYAKIALGSFLDGLRRPDVETALQIAAAAG
jgi:aminoglycoside phosphotransferase (APT) family kinase protein